MSRTPDVHPAEEFIAAFNQLDQAIRKRTGIFDRDRSFMAVFGNLAGTLRWLQKHMDDVRLIAELRNVLVHGTLAPRRYYATPEPSALAYVRKLHESITNPPTVGTRYVHSKGVSVVRPEDSLPDVLALVREHDFTHVPVVTETGIQGVLTATGVLRWLGRASGHESLMDLADVNVSEVLTAEDPEVESFRLIARLTPVPEALFTFAENPTLQALVITHSGTRHEKPIGIITTWDAVAGLGSVDARGPE